MNQRTFNLATGAIFAAIALLHLGRVLSGWPAVQVEGLMVPAWVSWIGLFVAGGLGYCGLRLAKPS